jgi:hypothetical protein
VSGVRGQHPASSFKLPASSPVFIATSATIANPAEHFELLTGLSARVISDDGSPHGLSAAQAAVPIWSDFMKQAIDAYPVPAFEIPDGIANVEIDITNGMAANRFCPAVAREVFLSGTEPPPCSEHHSPIERAVDETIDFWRRLRDRFRR